MDLRAWVTGSSKRRPGENLALPLELEDVRPFQTQKSILRVGCVTIIVVAIWVSVTPIRELAIAPGQILPRGDVRSVQHLEGGIVAEIVGKQGDFSKVHDPIVRLDDGQVGRELAQYKARLAALTLQKQQLSALLADVKLELRPSLGVDATATHSQQSVFNNRLRARTEEGKTLEARIAQRHSDITGLKNNIEGQKRLVDLYENSVSFKSDLYSKALTSRKELLADQTALEQAKVQLISLEGRLASTRDQLSEAESQFASAEADAYRRWSEEISKVATELLETAEIVAKLEDREARLTVRSNTDGIIQFIQPRSIGEVIKPGDIVARIVPNGAPLVAEVEVRPDDVGHVKVGDKTEIRVTTYDPSVYGKLQGMVESVSASTFQRQNGEYFFKALISLDRQQLSAEAPLSAGMVVSAEIITGAKPFSRYLLKPVFKTFSTAFSEK